MCPLLPANSLIVQIGNWALQILSTLAFLKFCGNPRTLDSRMINVVGETMSTSTDTSISDMTVFERSGWSRWSNMSPFNTGGGSITVLVS